MTDDIMNLRALMEKSPDADFLREMIGVISLDRALLDDTTERVNITLPRRVLDRLDAPARAAGESRSGYIARLTLEGTRPAR